jgi:HK97 family phage major capsid protein
MPTATGRWERMGAWNAERKSGVPGHGTRRCICQQRGIPKDQGPGHALRNLEFWRRRGALSTKATLTESPGTALVQAGYESGIVETLFQRLYVSDLMPQRQAPGNPVRFVQESTATNAAAAVAEAANKPESTLAFTEASEPIRKIATFLPVTDELLEDAPQIQAYLNQRLSLFVQVQDEAQLLLGNGTAPNLAGIISPGNRTIGTYARGTVDDNALAIFKAANGTRGSSQLEPDTVVIHPTNWQAIRTAKDSSGQYYGGGPFYGPYGGPQDRRAPANSRRPRTSGT